MTTFNGDGAPAPRGGPAAFDATLARDDATFAGDDTVDAVFTTGETQVESSSDGLTPARPSDSAATTRISTRVVTVLPRYDASSGTPRLITEAKTRYEVERRLGEGAAGAVDLALDHDILRQVAVKRLKRRDDDEADRAALLRFVDEIRLVGSLEHPNIVPIHDVGIDDDGNYYFVMKYVEGESLEAIIARLAAGDRETHRKYSFEHRMRIFDEILKAVEFAHAKGIIHRDLKPANIMVGPHGEVMVADWGIAKRILRNGPAEAPLSQDLAFAETLTEDAPAADTKDTGPAKERMYHTRDSSVVGTPAYMSPEQALGRVDELDERSDIYSLCAVAYELMALEPYLPPKQTLQELLMAVVSEEPRMPFLSNCPHQARVPAEYNHMIMRGLAKNPDERFQSVSEMRARLLHISEGFIPVQCPVTLTKRNIHRVLHLVDDHPLVGLVAIPAAFLAAAGLGATLMALLG